MCSNEEKAIYLHLIEIGCCINCAVRYLCDKQLEFSELDDFLSKKLTNDENFGQNDDKVKKSKSNPCIVCLGLLQEQVLTDILESTGLSNANEYDNPTFSVSISMPPSIMLREHSMRLYVTEKFPKFFTDEQIEIPINRVWKMFVKNALASKLHKTFMSSDVGDFFINITTEYNDDLEELKILQDMQPNEFKIRSIQHRKYHGELFTRKGVLSILQRTSEKLFRMYAACPPQVPTHFLKCKSIECKQNSCYIAGRYCKYSRELSQSPWVVDGVKLMETSVQEIMFEKISQTLNIRTENMKFASSGREDCDVRCLGDGRPFYIELIDPKQTQFTYEQFREMEDNINKSGLVNVRHFQKVAKTDIGQIKMGEESKTKTYLALCVAKQVVTDEMLSTINNYGKFVIQQKTPIRVLHRRPLSVRPRTIESMKASVITEYPNCFELEVTTQAGTYVKEFVHGDFGRTVPNLNEIIGCEVDIAALDVISINLDWPKTVTYK